jgi:hypothetical protein
MYKLNSSVKSVDKFPQTAYDWRGLRMNNLYKKIDSLSYSGAVSILKALCKDEGIAEKIEKLTDFELRSIRSEDVAQDIYDTLNCIDVFTLWEQSGETYHGYVEPTEMAYDMVTEAIEPYLQKMSEYAGLEMWEEEKICCCGIIKGLLTYDCEGTNEFHDWCTDDMTNIASDQIYEWKERKSAEDAVELQAIYDSFFE